MMRTAERQALILTDNDELAQSLSDSLAVCGLDAFTAPDVEDAVEHLESVEPTLLLADLDLERGNALDFVTHAQQVADPNPLLLLVSERSIDRAGRALENGAAWLLKKPISSRVLKKAIEQLASVSGGSSYGGGTSIYGSSPEIQSVLKVVAQGALSGAHVAITGEPGTGKRLVGRVIHERSRRSRLPFMQFSGHGMSESVVDEELFGGDETPGLTGMPRPGCLASCRGGTLLIDEIESLPMSIQRKLLAYLSEARNQAQALAHDVRVIAVSRQHLDESVREGRIHGGLAELLDGIRIVMPPLRDRRSDIPILVDHFSRRTARRLGKTLKGTAPDALARLMQYDWTGNVRELEDLIEHAVHSASDTLLQVDDLPSLPESAGPNQTAFRPGATIQEIEREVILRTLESTGGSTGRAAKILDMSVRKIQYKLKEYREDAALAARVEQVRSAAVPHPLPARSSEFVADTRERN